MSRARKHVLQEAIAGEVDPPGPDQCIVRALGARGGNLVEVRRMGNRRVGGVGGGFSRLNSSFPSLTPLLFCSRAHSFPLSKQVERPDKSTCMVLLPSRFHKKMWIKRGGFLIVRAPPEAAASGARLAGEVERVLYDQEVAKLKRTPGVWPKEFEEEGENGGGGGGGGGAGATTTGAGETTGDGGSGNGDEGPSSRKKKSADDAANASGSDSDDSGLPPLEENPNRRRQTYATSSSESDSEKEEEEDEEEEEEDEK